MASKETKTQKVKEHLLKYGTITSWQAIMQYKATRLSDIIFRLRSKGYEITTLRSDSEEHYGIYVLKRKENHDE